MIGILIMGAIALISGLLLVTASYFLAIKKSEIVEKVLDVLPGINCGACGYSGCEAYAKAISNEEAAIGLCPPGGKVVAENIALATGGKLGNIEEKIAIVMCQGNSQQVNKKMIYKGIHTCFASTAMYQGDSLCEFGCLGKGDCVKVCPYNAIAIKDELAVINNQLCMGCGVCEKECPKGIISVLSTKHRYHVPCKNTDKGAITRKVCKTGCIGCMKCQRICKQSAITVQSFCASINYETCNNCGDCVEVCPVSAIS